MAREKFDFSKLDEAIQKALTDNEQKIEVIHKKNGTKREIYTRPKK